MHESIAKIVKSFIEPLPLLDGDGGGATILWNCDVADR